MRIINSVNVTSNFKFSNENNVSKQVIHHKNFFKTEFDEFMIKRNAVNLL